MIKNKAMGGRIRREESREYGSKPAKERKKPGPHLLIPDAASTCPMSLLPPAAPPPTLLNRVPSCTCLSTPSPPMPHHHQSHTHPVAGDPPTNWGPTCCTTHSCGRQSRTAAATRLCRSMGIGGLVLWMRMRKTCTCHTPWQMHTTQAWREWAMTPPPLHLTTHISP